MSAPKYDAVLGYHMNPATCGVAKYNTMLAARLGVPYATVDEDYKYGNPLVSVKPSEFRHSVDELMPFHCDVLLHDRTWKPEPWVRRVFYADELGCPSTIQGDLTRGDFRVLTFGMAHKLQLPHYERLKAELDAMGQDYTVSVSTAVHEGSPWDETALVADKLRPIFGDRLRVLGYLADDALAKELQECDAVALYFDPALRANNTTYAAALEAGKPVFTNRDAFSPKEGAPPISWDDVIERLYAA